MADDLFNTQEAEIAGLVGKHLGVEPVKVTRDARFIDNLGADSLDALELVMMIEEHYSIEITDEECDKLWTVQDLFNVVADRRQ